MKKKSFLLILPLLLGGLASCGGGKQSYFMPFGSLFDESLGTSSGYLYKHTVNISYNELKSMIDEGRSFALIVFEYKTFVNGDAIGCTCYTNFAYAMNQYMKETNSLFYAVDPSDFTYEDGGVTHNRDQFGLTIGGYEGDATLAIFSGGSLKYQQTSSDEKLGSKSLISNYLSDKVRWSKMLYVNKSQMDILIDSGDQVSIGFFRSSCSDCTYLERNFLPSYNKKLDKPIYLIDCDVDGIRLSDGKYDATSWQFFKDNYGMSIALNASYGYGVGYTPTFLTYKGGSSEKEPYNYVVDGEVYFNDTLESKNGKVVVSESYWDGTRGHAFLSGVNLSSNLLGLEVPEGDYTENESGYYWSKAKAAIYHDPILEAYLDYYGK